MTRRHNPLMEKAETLVKENALQHNNTPFHRPLAPPLWLQAHKQPRLQAGRASSTHNNTAEGVEARFQQRGSENGDERFQIQPPTQTSHFRVNS